MGLEHVQVLPYPILIIYKITFKNEFNLIYCFPIFNIYIYNNKKIFFNDKNYNILIIYKIFLF